MTEVVMLSLICDKCGKHWAIEELNSKCDCGQGKILPPPGHGIEYTKEGPKLVSEGDYFERLWIEQQRRVTNIIHAAINKYMVDKETVIAPKYCVVSHRIGLILDVKELITPLYTIKIIVDLEVNDDYYYLTDKHPFEDAKEENANA